ncbi:MAG TPA: hypothetical protein VLG37_00485 [Candidatus Saccharimonadales bacterium]|nr:hypothetical protein [Candidatus Saccharimonadales bacterium]
MPPRAKAKEALPADHTAKPPEGPIALMFEKGLVSLPGEPVVLNDQPYNLGINIPGFKEAVDRVEATITDTTMMNEQWSKPEVDIVVGWQNGLTTPGDRTQQSSTGHSYTYAPTHTLPKDRAEKREESRAVINLYLPRVAADPKLKRQDIEGRYLGSADRLLAEGLLAHIAFVSYPARIHNLGKFVARLSGGLGAAIGGASASGLRWESLPEVIGKGALGGGIGLTALYGAVTVPAIIIAEQNSVSKRSLQRRAERKAAKQVEKSGSNMEWLLEKRPFFELKPVN